MTRPWPRLLLDTSVVLDPGTTLTGYDGEVAISTITLAELASGLDPSDPVIAADRQTRYARVVQTHHAIPYSEGAARTYGALCSALRRSGRNPRPRKMDLLIASVAVDERLPLLTRNADDFNGLQEWVHVIEVA